jgi:acetyl esterase/lipase
MIWVNGILAAFSLLAVLRAPAKPLWYAALAATEWGHFLAIGSLVLALVSWRLSRLWGAASWLALGAALLYITPLLRALSMAENLPAQLTASFGYAIPRKTAAAPARTQPIRMADLFLGVSSPPIQVTTVIYATVQNQSLSLDLYRPVQQKGLLPGVIVVHGGSWKSGNRGEFPGLSRYLAARGYLVAAIDYRFAPRAAFPAQRDDVFTAINYLKKHAHEIGLDPERLALLGRSAGGQIALSAAYAQKDPAIKGVIAFYTPSDLVWGYANPSPPLIMNSKMVLESYLGGKPGVRPGNYEAASPVFYVNKTTPPTLMIHGYRDELVSPRHDERLSERLEENKRTYFFLRLSWATHGCDANFSGPCGQLSTYAVERFLAAEMPVSLR